MCILDITGISSSMKLQGVALAKKDNILLKRYGDFISLEENPSHHINKSILELMNDLGFEHDMYNEALETHQALCFFK